MTSPIESTFICFSGFEDEMAGGCGISGDNLAALGAVYMAVGCVNSGSFAHETGHFFGLPHTFNPDESQTTELADGSNCSTDGDKICDTPADPYLTDSDETWIEDCAFVYEGKDANGDYYDPDMEISCPIILKDVPVVCISAMNNYG